jgi:DNA-binding transcriptional MerR regulator
MTEMLSIGQFARAVGLSPRALRSYDELDLLRPARVDPHTGYRRYLPSQVSQAELIRVSREMQMPLAQVAALLREEPHAAHERVDRHWAAITQQAAFSRSLASQIHQLIDGEDPREADTMDLQAIVIYVDDLAASMQFYGGNLGLPLVYEHAERAAYQLGASRLLLHPRGDGLEYPKRCAGEVTGRGIELSLGVDDVDGCIDRLRREGIAVVHPPADEPWGERDAVILDPDGLTVRLSQSLAGTWLST